MHAPPSAAAAWDEVQKNFHVAAMVQPERDVGQRFHPISAVLQILTWVQFPITQTLAEAVPSVRKESFQLFGTENSTSAQSTKDERESLMRRNIPKPFEL